jgi:hypothetical protein
MKIAFAGCSGTGKTTLAAYLAAEFNLQTNPHGSRSMAKEMGFVGPDGEGRPYDVDRADGNVYLDCLTDHSWKRMNPPPPSYTVIEAADEARRRFSGTRYTVRPLFQKKLQAAKIAWETQRSLYTPDTNPKPADGFVTDRTTLDDLAYTLMHAPDAVDVEFKERAYAHLATYDVIFYTPLAAGQWLGDDPARVPDPLYHWRYDVLLQGLLKDSGAQSVAPLWGSDLAGRKQHVRQVAKAYFLGETA